MFFVAALWQFVVHTVLIWLGALVAQIEYADLWRCIFTAAVSFIPFIIVRYLLSIWLLDSMWLAAGCAALLAFLTCIVVRTALSTDWGAAIAIAIMTGLGNWGLGMMS